MLDIDRLFEDYARAYMAGDAEWVANLYTAPFVAIREGRAIHLPDRRAVVEHLTEVMAGYRRAHAAVAEVAAIDVLEQGDGASLATVHWLVRATDRSVIRDFRTSYQLILSDPPRIVSYVNHDTVGVGGR